MASFSTLWFPWNAHNVGHFTKATFHLSRLGKRLAASTATEGVFSGETVGPLVDKASLPAEGTNKTAFLCIHEDLS